jgi:O-antigen ligase
MPWWHGGLVALLLAVLLLPRAMTGRRLAAASAPTVGLALFAAAALVGAIFAPYGYAAWLLLLELGAFLAVFALAARCGHRLLRWLGPALLVGAFAQAVLVVVSFAAGESRPAGTFLNANHLAGWLGAACLLVFGELLIRPTTRRRRLVALLALGLPVVVALFLTGSRGAMVGLAAGGTTLAVCAWPRLKGRRRQAVIAVALVCTVLAVALVVRRLGEADPFRYQRVRIWRASLQVTQERPWTGAGPRQFVYAARNAQFPDGDGPLRYDRGFTSTHSDLLRVPCEFGWPGAAALLVTLLATAQVLRARHRTGVLRDVDYAAIAALAALAAQSVVDNLSHRPALYLLGAALLGGLLSTPVEGARRLGLWPRSGLGGLLLVVFVVGDVAPYLAWSRANAATAKPPAAAAQDDLDAALRYNPIQPQYWRRFALRLAGDGTMWKLGEYAAAREAAELAVRLNPADSDAHWTLAQIEALACRTLFHDMATRERARSNFERAEQRSRYNPIIPLALARFLLDNGDAAGARRAAERALALEPESVQPRLVLAAALLSGPPTDSSQRAKSLLAEAEERARRWADRAPWGYYADQLLRPEPRMFDRVRSKLAAAQAAVPAVDATRSEPAGR